MNTHFLNGFEKSAGLASQFGRVIVKDTAPALNFGKVMMKDPMTNKMLSGSRISTKGGVITGVKDPVLSDLAKKVTPPVPKPKPVSRYPGIQQQLDKKV